VTPDRPVRVERFDSRRHLVSEFDCGFPALDRWLRAYAGQSQRAGAARNFVAAREDGKVVGYYTLVAGQVEYEAASAPVRERLSRHYPIPICLIARLAVTRSVQGAGLGRDLTRDAIQRIAKASEEIGIRAVLVDAANPDAAGFWARLGFQGATPDGLTMMIPIAAALRNLAID